MKNESVGALLYSVFFWILNNLYYFLLISSPRRNDSGELCKAFGGQSAGLLGASYASRAAL
ncbi:MAG TPA: hypothetical protein PK683_07345, partial [Leptospiraceae bacterium]|nr:hypothetical protein [Leptospiraceae bacterium]